MARTIHRSRRPRKPCEFVQETWGPHPGCAEFMEKPEIHRCPDPATHVLKFTDYVWTGQPPTGYIEGRAKMRLCTFHSRNRPYPMGLGSPTNEKLYLFRRVAS